MALETFGGIVEQIHVLAGFQDDEEPDGIGALAVALFGPGQVAFGPADQVPPYVLCWGPRHTSPRLLVRGDVEDEDLTMAVARGIARWWRETHLLPPLHELHVEALAIELALPERGFRSAAVRCGCNVESLAREFVCPASVVKVRLRELFRQQSGMQIRLVHAS